MGMSEGEADYEKGLPTWQQWINGFLENWIFAFIVAMVIRQFFLEPFVIPTASMEPMLLGSPRMSRADHVVVNKFTHRFTEAERWDVTVFEFPIQEIASRRGREQQIWGLSKDEPESNWLFRPLQHRNFVKRLCVLPGDTFYVAGGDIYIKGPDGTFDVARKPESVQEVLWQPVYEHGIDEGYLPWSKGASLKDSLIHIKPGAQAVLFQQPLSNLYMKDGKFRVYEKRNMKEAIVAELSMLKPRFTFKNKSGNAWDLDKWAIYRLSDDDLDSVGHGSLLNRHMSEAIGDVRVSFTPEEISGSVNLLFYDRDATVYGLKCQATSWQLFKRNEQKEVLLHQGSAEILGKQLRLVALDNQLWVELDGVALHEALQTASADKDKQACRLAWSGNGHITLAACAIERDVHYSTAGFTADLRQDLKAAESWSRQTLRFGQADDENSALARAQQEAQGHVDIKNSNIVVQSLIRERLLGRVPTAREATAPIGVSPATAITAPEDAYLLFGDNSPFSWDSRNWGWVPGSNIRGRAAWVVFPFGRWKRIR